MRLLESRLYRTVGSISKRVRCPVCGWTGARFAPSRKPRRPNRICPACGSSERCRALILLLEKLGPVPAGTRLIEVAPINTVQPTAEALGYTYSSVDLRSPRARVLADLTAMPFEAASAPVIVCSHVLEHVPDDATAVRELARVAGPDGRVLVVVPRDENRSITFEVEGADPADYERLYGQSDHVRIYGRDLEDRWRAAGVDVSVELWVDHFDAPTHRSAALDGDDDRFWILTTGPTQMAGAPNPA